MNKAVHKISGSRYMDVSSFESNTQRAANAESVTDLADEAFAEHQFPDLSLKHLIARFIVARGAVVRATNPGLADEYLKFATVFQWNEPAIAQLSTVWTKA